jgi:FkbM family methyltransferase
MTPQERRVIPWIKARGDQTLRLTYAHLSETSVVVDAGGYEGQWSSDLFARYRCNIHIFEPVSGFAEHIQRRFAGNPKIRVHPVALGAKQMRMTMAVAQDGSSLYKQNQASQEVDVVCALDYFRTIGISHLDLFKLNIEGAEYDLLEHLIASGFVGRCTDIQVQFHDFVPRAEERMRAIQRRLAETHALTFQYPFVWENWHLKLAA